MRAIVNRGQNQILYLLQNFLLGITDELTNIIFKDLVENIVVGQIVVLKSLHNFFESDGKVSGCMRINKLPEEEKLKKLHVFITLNREGIDFSFIKGRYYSFSRGNFLGITVPRMSSPPF